MFPFNPFPVYNALPLWSLPALLPVEGPGNRTINSGLIVANNPGLPDVILDLDRAVRLAADSVWCMRNVPDDGDCFYHAIALCMGSQVPPQQLRLNAKAYGLRHGYDPGVLELVFKPGEWAGEEAIEVVAKLLKVTIVVLSPKLEGLYSGSAFWSQVGKTGTWASLRRLFEGARVKNPGAARTALMVNIPGEDGLRGVHFIPLLRGVC